MRTWLHDIKLMHPAAGTDTVTFASYDATQDTVFASHPFLTRAQGWVAAGALVVGIQVLRGDGTLGIVTGWRAVVGSQEMDNLEVAQDHTFLVGNGRWIVHNACEAIAVPRHPAASTLISAANSLAPGPLRAEEASTPQRQPERPLSVERRRKGRTR